MGDNLSTTDDGETFTSVFNRVEEVGEVPCCVGRAHLGHPIRLSESSPPAFAAMPVPCRRARAAITASLRSSRSAPDSVRRSRGTRNNRRCTDVGTTPIVPTSGSFRPERRCARVVRASAARRWERSAGRPSTCSSTGSTRAIGTLRRGNSSPSSTATSSIVAPGRSARSGLAWVEG